MASDRRDPQRRQRPQPQYRRGSQLGAAGSLQLTTTAGTNFTPNFPSYTSGHASFGSALFQILRRYCQTDAIAFRFQSDEYNRVTRDDTGKVRPCRTRRYADLTQAELENHDSRIYLGVHWRFDQHLGLVEGRALANSVIDNYLLRAHDWRKRGTIASSCREAIRFGAQENPVLGGTGFASRTFSCKRLICLAHAVGVRDARRESTSPGCGTVMESTPSTTASTTPCESPFHESIAVQADAEHEVDAVPGHDHGEEADDRGDDQAERVDPAGEPTVERDQVDQERDPGPRLPWDPSPRIGPTSSRPRPLPESCRRRSGERRPAWSGR